MGTETLKRPKENDRISTGNTVKLNNPLMGTETPTLRSFCGGHNILKLLN